MFQRVFCSSANFINMTIFYRDFIAVVIYFPWEYLAFTAMQFDDAIWKMVLTLIWRKMNYFLYSIIYIYIQFMQMCWVW